MFTPPVWTPSSVAKVFIFGKRSLQVAGSIAVVWWLLILGLERCWTMLEFSSHIGHPKRRPICSWFEPSKICMHAICGEANAVGRWWWQQRILVIVNILKLMTRVSQVSVSSALPHSSPSMTFEEKEEELLRIYGEAWHRGPCSAWQAKRKWLFFLTVSASFPKETLEKLWEQRL